MPRLRFMLVTLLLPALFPLLAGSQGPIAPPSVSSESAREDQDSADGLRFRLQDLLDAAKDQDRAKLKSLIKQMEIPDYAAWFEKILGEEDGKLASDNYRGNFADGDTFIETLFTQLAGEKGEFTFRKTSDHNPGDEPGVDELPRKSRPGLGNPYIVNWEYQTPSASRGIRTIGLFTYLDGSFRWLSVFRIPPQVPGMTSYPPVGPMPETKQAADAPDKSSAGGNDQGTYRSGVGGVGYPTCVYCPDPEYTREARARHLEGVVILQVTVTPDGQAADIKVVKAIDPGLTQKAIEAISRWRFKPARRADGEAVPVMVPIEMNFRLLK